jgi:hypothetical protein
MAFPTGWTKKIALTIDRTKVGSGGKWILDKLDVAVSTRSAESAGGSGANAVTITVNDGAAAIEGATVRVTKGAESFLLTTDASGEADFSLDDGTWTVSITASGYEFTPATIAVTTSATFTKSMTQVVFPASDPAACTVHWIAQRSGAVRAGEVFVFTCTAAPAGSGNVYINEVRSATSEGAGDVTIELPRSSVWSVKNNTTGKSFSLTVPDAATYEPANVLV